MMDSAVNMQVGAAIRFNREKRLRVTQDELAQRLEISRPSVANIEKGRQQLTVVQLIRFARVLGVSPSDLLPPDQVNLPQRPLSHALPDDIDSKIREWVDRLTPENE